MEWTTVVSLAARAGKQGYDHRRAIQKYFTKVKAYLDTGNTQIVVTGAAGAGKSLLVAQMHGRARELYYDAPPQSLDVEVEAITLEPWTKLVRVLPGQSGLRTACEIESLDENPDLEGVIHVVDFGFVSPRDPALVRALIEQDRIDTIEKLRAHNLRAETDTLKALLVTLDKTFHKWGRPKWMVVAVNKVDLFWNSRDQALATYHPVGRSEFGRALLEFQHRSGANAVGIYVLPACAYEVDFQWNGSTTASLLPRQQQNLILREFMTAVARISEIHS